jgi:exosortase
MSDSAATASAPIGDRTAASGSLIQDFTDFVRTVREGVQADRSRAIMAAITTAAFLLLYGEPIRSLVATWWDNPDAGHGLLLAPVAIWLAISAGKAPGAHPQKILGGVLLLMAVGVRSGAGLAAGLTLARASLLLALVAITIYYASWRQVKHWWLPFSVITLSMPIPEFLLGEIALPLQLKASELGAALLRLRDVPVMLTGNVIRLPGHELFVTEACSGLRSLTALISMAVLLGGLVLTTATWRLVLVFFALVVAVLVNGFRVFLTGFLVYFVDPALAEGFMHLTEGFLLFLCSLAFLMAFLQVARLGERYLRFRPAAEVA